MSNAHPAAMPCVRRTASNEPCGNTTINRPPDCGRHTSSLDDPLFKSLVGVDISEEIKEYRAPEESDGTDTPLVVGCPVITVTRADGWNVCDECGVVGRRKRDIADHIRREHRALPTFGPVAEALRDGAKSRAAGRATPSQ